MTRGQRFGLWVVVIVGCLSAPIWITASGTTPTALLTSTIHSIVAMSALIFLMLTTPRDAIRLSWWMSAACISIGMWWLLGCVGGMDGVRANLIQLFIGTSAIWIIARWARVDHARAAEKPLSYSPWLSCILLWGPLSWIGPITNATDTEIGSVMMVLGFGLLLLCMVAAGKRYRSGTWAAWILHAVMILAWVGWAAG